MTDIKRNRIQCLVCNDVIESKSIHHFVKCKCGACFTDGGNEYQRFGADAITNILFLPFDDAEKNKLFTENIQKETVAAQQQQYSYPAPRPEHKKFMLEPL